MNDDKNGECGKKGDGGRWAIDHIMERLLLYTFVRPYNSILVKMAIVFVLH